MKDHPGPPPDMTREELWAIIVDLRQKLAAVTEALRETKRPRAAFSKGTRKPNPKPPGRRAGEGVFTNRQEPDVRPQDNVENIDVPLELDQRNCPKCQVPLETRNEKATTIEIPALPPRDITIFNVEVGCCPQCQYKTRGKHPKLKPTQAGATANQLGPKVTAQALALHYSTGLPLRKVPQVISALTGIKMTQSTLTQKACNLCDEGGILAPHYEALRLQVEQSRVVNTDDTGWRVGMILSFLMGFFTDTICFFQIRSRHRHQEVQEVLGDDFQGIVGCDRGPSYRAEEFDLVEMQKCLSHILKNITEVVETKTGRAKHFGTLLKATLKETIELWKTYKSGEIDEEQYRRQGKELQDSIEHQLRNRNLTDIDNQRLLDGIGVEQDRGRLLLFLEHPEVEPTNNRAERGLRPAVIARKVSQCSKNERGANAYAMMRTIFGTLQLQSKDPAAAFVALLEGKSWEEACRSC